MQVGALGKAAKVFQEQGAKGLMRAGGARLARVVTGKPAPQARPVACDILFIAECGVPYLQRFRVDHPMEQLRAQGLTCEKVDYMRLELGMVRLARGFVFYRTPVTPTIEKFIAAAKALNKTCFYSIDDLVVDTRYTDELPAVQAMDAQDRERYDDSVNKMGACLDLCDHAIVTTNALQAELEARGGVRDVFVNRNVAGEQMVRCAEAALAGATRDPSEVVIGYFSGTDTHDDDLAMVAPALARVMDAHENVLLRLGGHLKVPNELGRFGSRVTCTPFVDWRELPVQIAQSDIVIAPLRDGLFNRAKSEIKWLDAALVKVPTVASRLGAFVDAITDGVDGVLVSNDAWFESLDALVADPERRQSIGDRAYATAHEKYMTISSGAGLAEFIQQRLAPSIAFVCVGIGLSGGMIVVVKHAEILRRHGFDVYLVHDTPQNGLSLAAYGDVSLSVLCWQTDDVQMGFDQMVATFWSTLDIARSYPRRRTVSYLVQGNEPDFYSLGDARRLQASATYAQADVNYVTMSKWIRQWLKDDFGQQASYASNGLDLRAYPKPRRRDLSGWSEFPPSGGRVRILIEGPNNVGYKRIDEAFRIVELLPVEQLDVTYMCYGSQPKGWYRVDRLYQDLPVARARQVYAECDILLKTSVLESFSLPPLEMMATGGLCVMVGNPGNAEYAVDGENCLMYQTGDIDGAVAAVKRLLADDALQAKLFDGGVST
ncbi:MAG: glycosyltransferase family 4 protein, partial [Propionibacteriaceae bacterium]|nr:glycosyltransferase family 4 protein [Propionibacteriaceae bacterium]